MIVFENVSYSYEAVTPAKGAAGRRRNQWGEAPEAPWALHDVSFELKDGEFLGIAGHTGSGKSTLLQHMNGLLQPTSGRVLVDGADLADKHEAARVRRRVGLVFQYPEHQLFANTVFDDVAFGPRNLGFAPDKVERCVIDALRMVDFDPEAVRDASPFELSGGQQRRVAFAGVLAMGPSTLVLDEPAAGLDPAARRDFLALVQRLHSRQGVTIAMVSHSMDDLASLATRVLVLNGGKVCALGTPAQVFSNAEALKRVGLDMPAAPRMARDLAQAGVALGPCKGVHTLDSLADAIARAYAAQGRAPVRGREA